MKKWLVSIVLLLTTVGLVACGGMDETAEDVYANALEASENMESAEVEMEMVQEMMVPGESEAIEMESMMAGSIIIDPVAMYQKGTTSMSMAGESMEMEQEIYLVDNEIYMFDSMTNQWMKMDDSMIPMDMLNGQQMDASEQLQMLEEYIEEIDFEEADDAYVLQLSADGEGIKKLSEELMDDMLPEDLTAQLGADMDEILDMMEIKDLQYEILIDKETYNISEYNVEMDITITEAEEEMNMKQQVKTVYKNINSVETIEVPQEVKESAVDAPGL